MSEMIDKKKLERRFSRHAKTYDEYAVVQKEMSHKLMGNIEIDSPLNILEIGCGTGYLTALIAEKYPQSNIVALDLAPGMIEVAKERLSSLPSTTVKPIAFKCADAEAEFPQGPFDLIISNATFQWFNNPEQMALNVLDNLTPKGQCLFSTFGNQTFAELGESFKLARLELEIEEDVRASQNFLTAYEWVMRLEKAKEELSVQAAITSHEALLPEYFEDCMAFFQSIKKIGANNASASRSKSSPKFMQTVTDIYEKEYMTDKGLCATYHALYLSVKKV